MESLDDSRKYNRGDFHGGRSNGVLGDQNAGLKIVGIDVVNKHSHLFDADGIVAAEFYPDSTDAVVYRVGILRCGRGRVFLYHGEGRVGGEGHLLATDVCVSYDVEKR